MNKVHATTIALLLGAAAVLGTVAAIRTVGLGHAAAPSAPASAQAGTTSSTIAWRARRLDRIETALRQSLRSRPPKLPPVPAAHHPAVTPPPSVVAAPVAAAPPRVVYQRPPPVVVIKHHAHGDSHEPGNDGEASDD
jgi:hypothetical protein